MSLRRSARVNTLASVPAKTTAAAKPTTTVTKSTKRGRKPKEPVTENIATRAVGQEDDIHDGGIPEKMPFEIAMASPEAATSKNKRRRITKEEAQPPPVTPTPAAIAFMTKFTPAAKTYSSGDIDDATPPPEANGTNAILTTPGGTQLKPEPIYSNFEDNASPSKEPPPLTAVSGPTILETGCAHLIKVDTTGKLAPLIAAHPCRVFSPSGMAEEIDPFRSLASGIMAQQVSGAAAKSIKNKFINLFDAKDCVNGFPKPEVVATMTVPKGKEAGLSGRKAEYIQGLAAKFVSGELTVKGLMEGTDEAVMRDLVAVRGLGKWSVEMFMCFGLKRMDVLSVGDLGVERGMAAYADRDVKRLKANGKGKSNGKYMKPAEMEEFAEKFRPYRSLFMWYMWRIEEPVNLEAIENA